VKIGMITQWYDPEPGPAALPGVLARELVQRGHSVQVLTGFPNYPSGKLAQGYALRPRMTEILDGVHVTRTFLFPSHDDSLVRRLANYGSFGISAAALGVDALKDVDVVWVNYSPITVALPMLLQRYLRGTPIVTEVADLWPDTVMVSGFPTGSALGKVAHPVLNGWVNAMYRGSDAVVHIAPSVGETLRKRGVPESKLHYIPKPANETVFYPGGSSVRSELGLSEEQVVLVYAGAMGAAQGLETLVEAARSLDPADVVCVLAGGGNEEPRLRALAGNHAGIRFIGRLPQDRMTDLMATADIAYISLVEDPLTPLTMPSKTQAILASGTPALVAASGDVVNVIEQSGSGMAVDQRSPESIAQGIRHLAGLGRQGLREMGATARSTYENQFSLQHTTDLAERLLARVAGAEIGQGCTSDFRIVPLQRRHVPEVAALHRRSFPQFFLSELGEGFLREFYGGFLHDPSAVTAVALDVTGAVQGAVVGTTEPEGFFRRLLQRRLIGFASRSAAFTLRHPARAPRLLRAVGYRGDAPKGRPGGALLSSICVDPLAQGSGIGRSLVEAWTAEAEHRGATEAFLTTDAEDNVLVNTFYQSLGWTISESYETPEGRRMHRYATTLDASAEERTDING
jgi:colanic acid biosynthesis glycosyl transferase WcaI